MGNECSFPKFPPQTRSCSRSPRRCYFLLHFPRSPCILHWCLAVLRRSCAHPPHPSWCRLPGRKASLRGIIRRGNAMARWKSEWGRQWGLPRGRGATVLPHLSAQPAAQGGSPSPPTKQDRQQQGAWTPARSTLTVVNGIT